MIKLCGCKKAKSLPGLLYSVGLCQQHYNMWMFGNPEEHREAARYKAAVRVTKEEWHKMQTPEYEHECKHCGMPSQVDPSDQTRPPDYCHESDHMLHGAML